MCVCVCVCVAYDSLIILRRPIDLLCVCMWTFLAEFGHFGHTLRVTCVCDKQNDSAGELCESFSCLTACAKTKIMLLHKIHAGDLHVFNVKPSSA